MGLLLILPLLVSGYLVCTKHPYYLARLHRYDGQLLYLLVAKLGISCLVFSLALCLIAFGGMKYFGWYDYQSWIEEQLSVYDPSMTHVPLYAFMLQVGIVAMFIPWPWTIAGNLLGRLLGHFSGVSSPLLYYTFKNMLGDNLGKLIFGSFANQKMTIMLHLDDRKVYVGYVSALSDPNERSSAHSTFAFVPTYSGYRDKDTLKVRLVTTYPKEQEIALVLRSENVLSATRWNLAQWENFSKQKDPTEPHQSFRQRVK